MFSNNGLSASDVALLSGNGRNNDGFAGDGWGWIWILLIFCVFGGWGNGGWGFGGGNGGANSPGFQGWATRADLNESFMLNDIQSGIRGVQQGICDSTYALNNSIANGFHGTDMALCNGFNGVQSQMANLGYQLQDCCCQTQRAIDGVNYNMATNTCNLQNTMNTNTRDIIDSQNAGTRAILDFLTNDKISTLTAENQSLKFQASQTAQNAFITANQEAQTAELIRRINPPAVPAYVVPNPNAYACGCGYNVGCGC